MTATGRWFRIRLDWVIVGVLAMSLAVLGSWPWLTSGRAQPAQSVFLGANIPDVLDSQVYYAFIQANADGHALYTNQFTAEPQSAALVNPLWWILGRLVVLTGGSAITVFWVAKAVLGTILVGCLYALLRPFFPDPRWRLLALVLSIFGAGLGWAALLGLSANSGLIWAYQSPQIVSSLPVDLTYPAAFPWLSVVHSPLNTLALIFVLGVWALFARALTQQRWIHGAGALLLLLGLTHPYDIVLVIGGIVAVLIIGIMRSVIDQVIAKKILRQLGVLMFWLLPAIVYYAGLLLFVPSIAQWNEQNVLETTNLRNILTGFFPGIFLAIIGLKFWSKASAQLLVLLAWVGAALMLMYAPFFQYQAKMVLGLQIPFAVLAVAGLQLLWQRQSLARMIGVIAVGGMLLTPSIFLARVTDSQRQESRYHYLAPDLYASLRWIKAHTPTNAVVLGDVWTGNVVPYFSGRTTYLGHQHQTAQFEKKLELVRDWFLEDNAHPAEKISWLHREGIHYLIDGPFERHQGTFDPAELPGLRQVFQSGQTSIWQVEPTFGE